MPNTAVTYLNVQLKQLRMNRQAAANKVSEYTDHLRRFAAELKEYDDKILEVETAILALEKFHQDGFA